MSLWDYLLPWKAIPNMVKDVKEASSTKGPNKHSSVVGAIGKYADPAGALLGDNWMNFWHGTVPEQVNRSIQPWNELHMRYLDPLTMSGVVGKSATDAAKYKGGDLTALALGGTALGMATGGFGLGGGGSGGGFQNPYANTNWQDPQTYMRMAQSMPQQRGGLGQPRQPGVMYQPMNPIDPSASASTMYALNYGLGQYRPGRFG